MTNNDDALLTNKSNDGCNVEETTQNKTDSVNLKNDKRKRESHDPEKWKEIQKKRLTAFRNKQAEKKQKLELYDSMKIRVQELEKILEENNVKIPQN